MDSSLIEVSFYGILNNRRLIRFKLFTLANTTHRSEDNQLIRAVYWSTLKSWLRQQSTASTASTFSHLRWHMVRRAWRFIFCTEATHHLHSRPASILQSSCSRLHHPVVRQMMVMKMQRVTTTAAVLVIFRLGVEWLNRRIIANSTWCLTDATAASGGCLIRHLNETRCFRPMKWSFEFINCWNCSSPCSTRKTNGVSRSVVNSSLRRMPSRRVCCSTWRQSTRPLGLLLHWPPPLPQGAMKCWGTQLASCATIRCVRLRCSHSSTQRLKHSMLLKVVNWQSLR